MQNILNLCTCPQPQSLQHKALEQQLSSFTGWSQFPHYAEKQGLGPLAYTYLHSINTNIPREHKIRLQGLYLRHRHANKARGKILAEIITAFQTVNIDAIALKGAALAHLVYNEPGLRPMRDLDILVRKSDILMAREVLIGLGFDAPLDMEDNLPNKHLEFASREFDGFSHSVELHHNLFDSFAPRSMTFETLRSELIEFEIEGVTVSALGPEDMLLHLCEHIAYHASIWEPIRLIWVADTIGFAERFAEKIDWKLIKDRDPIVLKMLSLFHHICPLSSELQKRSQVKIGPTPLGVGQEFNGWPRYSWIQLRGLSYSEILKDTFFPSEWWLRLHYRLDSVQTIFWYRWFYHPLFILGPLYIVEKIKLFWHLKVRSEKIPQIE